MKAVILAGGYGTRLSEETTSIPKPMVEIGGRPILWHIMKMYSAHGINDFIVCTGYKSYIISEFFSNYFLYMSDVTFDIANNVIDIHHKKSEPWKVTVVDTGVGTMTGGRLKRVAPYLDDQSFCMTYGDGVSDVNITELLKFHKDHGRLATVTAVPQPGRFGVLQIDSNLAVSQMLEKPKDINARINGGFFVLEPQVIDYITGDETIWEREPLEMLAQENKLMAFQHDGFWQPMDTLREKILLEELWQTNTAPWKVW